ncbi:MAG: hypothetical protein ACRC8D_14560, partial [Aeromonas sp.]
NLLKSCAILIATGVAFYAHPGVSQALFHKAFSHFDRLAACAALPCRRRRIIGSEPDLATGNLRKITHRSSFAQIASNAPQI